MTNLGLNTVQCVFTYRTFENARFQARKVGLFRWKSVSFWNVIATSKADCSSQAFATTCRARGRPSASKPQGTETPGKPARLPTRVKAAQAGPRLAPCVAALTCLLGLGVAAGSISPLAPVSLRAGAIIAEYFDSQFVGLSGDHRTNALRREVIRRRQHTGSQPIGAARCTSYRCPSIPLVVKCSLEKRSALAVADQVVDLGIGTIGKTDVLDRKSCLFQHVESFVEHRLVLRLSSASSNSCRTMPIFFPVTLPGSGRNLKMLLLAVGSFGSGPCNHFKNGNRDPLAERASVANLYRGSMQGSYSRVG